MKNTGKLFVLEGIDGSGKSTQFERLLARAAADGKALTGTTFPNYESVSGKLVSTYLSGAFGTRPGDVNAYAAASIFAVDRFASFKTDPWGAAYSRGESVLSARYTTSNAIHQASKLPKDEWTAFFAWLADYEYRDLALPEPDAVFLLDIPTETALEMINSRAARLGTSPDIHERDTAYLLHCAEASHAAAEFFGWTRIPVTQNGKLLPIEEITDKLYALLAL